VDHFADVIVSDTGVDLHQLPRLTSLLVWTANTPYHIVVMEGTNIYVQGGPFFPESTPACLDGAHVGGTLLRVGWIGVGFPMEIHAGGEHFVTSPVRAITTVDRPGMPAVH
jgi:hypothetical protein